LKTGEVKMKGITHVVVGVLRQGQQLLVAKRRANQSHAHCWEFPGGKVQAGESLQSALQREILEEVGLSTTGWQPLIGIPWDYDDVTVRLHVFVTESWTGKAAGQEGQEIAWKSLSELNAADFPAANRGILNALNLADRYMISGSFHDQQDALARLQVALEDGVRLIQLRAKQLEEVEFFELAQQAIALTHQTPGAKMLINGKPEWLAQLPEVDGIQLPSSALMGLTKRPIPDNKLLGVSTHTPVEMAKALELGADFLLLSPVKKTASHPALDGLGWQAFADYVADIPVPVYALGGMKPQDVKTAKQYGGQGISAISGLWPEPI